MFRNYTYHLFLILIVGILACQPKKQAAESSLYVKPPADKLDSLTNWFADEVNFNDKNYFPQFYSHYNQKIKAERWEEAAILLYHVGQISIVHNRADSLIIRIHDDFTEQHQDHISNRYKSGLYLNLGILYYYDSNFEASIKNLQKVIQMPYKDYYSLENKSTAYNELGYIYTEIGKFDKALRASFKALDTFLMLKDTLGLGAGYDSISGIYMAMKDYQNAEIYMDKAISALKSINNHMGVMAVYLNKSGLYQETNNPRLEAIVDSMYAYHESYNFGNESYKAYIYSWKAYNYLKRRKIAEAQKLMTEIRPLFEKADEKFLYSQYIETASLYSKMTGKKLIEKDVYKQVIPKYKESKNLKGLLSCYEALRIEAIEEKDYKTALFYTDAYDEVYNSLTDRMLIIKTKELDKKYQTEKKEQQIQLQNQEITQKNTYIALLVVSLSVLLLTVFAYSSWQRQKLLRQEKTNSMNFTKQLLENTEEERKRIASDLHDSISHELLNLKSIFTQDLATVNTKIDTIINDIRGISRNLHPVMFDKIGLLPNIEQLVERLQNQNNFFISTEINYEGTLSSADELQIYRIIQEALTNIIKYAQAHAAKITIAEQKDGISIEIKDNGKGFDVKQVLNSGKAFGLHNIIERSRVIGGEASFYSSPEGTIIHIIIPKKS
ncbi:MAG: tetratricopeptide repeat-containing sensor histidine kinase [Emticicia sp.]|uniref:tetratricopeptide repeat-containing sensor histidine kinase n=1 Tax=Emticicia sp. TaxID=1930953 RepID=UPI003BA58781